MNTVDKYYWIYDHPQLNFEGTPPSIEITPHMINPETFQIDDDASLNVALEWWIEVCVEYYDYETDSYGAYHDHELDCGGFTAEDAISALYTLVLKKYGDYEE